MCECGSLHTNAAQRYDPTRTTSLRQRFEGEAARRFRWLKGRINRAVIEENGFGLGAPVANRGEFDFPRSADKVGAFMQWLQSQANAGILEIRQGEPLSRAADRAWSSVYVRSAYQRGLAQSSAKLRAEGVEVAPQWITEAFTRPFHVDRAALAYTRTFEDLVGITQAMSTQISRELAEGLASGNGSRDIARAMNDRVDKIGITRARMLARTETIRAHAEASLNTYEEAGVMGVGVEAEWRTARDNAVCAECEDAAQAGPYTLEEARGMIPLHPNCLPGDSLVLARSGITAASKRWFEGDLVIITTTSGRKLTCTPNHPILLDTGWQAAKSISLGDNVISDGLRDGPAFGHGDDKHVPTQIHEVAEAFGRSGSVVARPVPVSAPDFHGDGMHGDVAQVWTDRSLWQKVHASIFQEAAQLGFVMADVVGGLGAGLRALDQFIMASLSAPNGIMGSGDLSRALIGRHEGPLDGFGFGLGAHSDTSINHPSVNSATADAKFARNIIAGATGPVFADEVINVDVQRFSGHVYNLESGNHSYIAQGIVSHNCRCAWVPEVVNPRDVRLS